jgi:hypothetical protein
MLTPNAALVNYASTGTSRTFTATWTSTCAWSGFILQIAALQPYWPARIWGDGFETGDFTGWTARDVNAQLTVQTTTYHQGTNAAHWLMTAPGNINLYRTFSGVTVPTRVEFWVQGASSPSAGNMVFTGTTDTGGSTTSWRVLVDWVGSPTNKYRIQLDQVYNDSGTNVGPSASYNFSDGGTWFKVTVIQNPGVGGNVTLVLNDGEFVTSVTADNTTRAGSLGRFSVTSGISGTNVYIDDVTVSYAATVPSGAIALYSPTVPAATGDLDIEACIVDDIARKWDDVDGDLTPLDGGPYPRTTVVSNI